MTLAEAGCETVAMVTEHPRHQTYAPLKWIAARRTPILTGSRVADIRGRERVEAVALDDGRVLECDTLVFTGDWIPDHELARRGGLAIDDGTRGPAVDQLGRTSAPGVFATGNLVHAAETGDVAAVGGGLVARHVARFLETRAWTTNPVPLGCVPPLRWVWPNTLDPATPPPEQFVLRVAEFVPGATLVVTQGTTVLHRRRLGDAVPNRSIRLPGSWAVRATPREPLRWTLGA
jgi:hypothetical protein